MTTEEFKKALKSDSRVKFTQGTHGFSVDVGDFRFIVGNVDETKIGYRLFYLDPLDRHYYKTEWRNIKIAEVEKYDLKKLIDIVFDAVWD